MYKRNFFTFKLFVYFLIISLILAYSFLLSTKWNNSSKATFNIIEKNKLVQKDLTGDKKKDILYINCENDKYYVQINTENRSLQLNPNKKIASLGNHCNYWPMRVSLKDISNNGIPEIFIQSCYNDKSLQNIFLWKNECFENIHYNQSNILGFIDTTNDKKAKCIVGNFLNNSMKFNTYILIKDKMEKINYFYPKNFMGKDIISTLINSIEKKFKFKFQDAFFCDLEYTNYNTVSSIKWTLNFKGSSKNLMKNYTFEIILKTQPNNSLKHENLKIYSIKYK